MRFFFDMRLNLIITLMLAIPLVSTAQTVVSQDSLFGLYMEFMEDVKDFKLKKNREAAFRTSLRSVLQSDPEGKQPFDSLRKYRVFLESPDKQVRLFTWELPQEDGTFIYSGLLQIISKKTDEYVVFELKDASREIRNPENAILTTSKWYGAFYYDIIPVKYKRKKYYVLLGWNAHNRITNKRLIDVLEFDNKGFPKFGHSMFTTEKGKVLKRMIFEFQAGLFMSLKYEKGKEAIVFDHLSPSDPNLEGQFQFYGPDFTYDMLEFEDGRWQYKANVQPRNDKSKGDKLFNQPH